MWHALLHDLLFSWFDAHIHVMHILVGKSTFFMILPLHGGDFLLCDTRATVDCAQFSLFVF